MRVACRRATEPAGRCGASLRRAQGLPGRVPGLVRAAGEPGHGCHGHARLPDFHRATVRGGAATGEEASLRSCKWIANVPALAGSMPPRARARFARSSPMCVLRTRSLRSAAARKNPMSKPNAWAVHGDVGQSLKRVVCQRRRDHGRRQASCSYQPGGRRYRPLRCSTSAAAASRGSGGSGSGA